MSSTAVVVAVVAVTVSLQTAPDNNELSSLKAVRIERGRFTDDSAFLGEGTPHFAFPPPSSSPLHKIVSSSEDPSKLFHVEIVLSPTSTCF